MEEIVKHINDTNASYRTIGAGDAKNTDLFLDNEHYELFKGVGGPITVRFNKENLSKAILFIASILPRKYDNSAIHNSVAYSAEFVYDQLLFLDYYFKENDVPVVCKTQQWNPRKDVPKKNGEIDNRFYFNGLLEDVDYVNHKSEHVTSKFTIRNYLAGGYSDLHIKKADDGIYDVWITNVQQPYFDSKEDGLEMFDKNTEDISLQRIFYGAPGTGKSHKVKDITKRVYPKKEERDEFVFRTTFHPDYDYASFVGCYKPKKENDKITYSFIPQVFTNAYVKAWNAFALPGSPNVFSFQHAYTVYKIVSVETEQVLLKTERTIMCKEVEKRWKKRMENGVFEWPQNNISSDTQVDSLCKWMSVELKWNLDLSEDWWNELLEKVGEGIKCAGKQGNTIYDVYQRSGSLLLSTTIPYKKEKLKEYYEDEGKSDTVTYRKIADELITLNSENFDDAWEKLKKRNESSDSTNAVNNSIKQVYLVIEEINRGNCAQIFGDLFQLLDRGDDGYSEYPIDIDDDLKNYLIEKLGSDSEGVKDGKMCLPPNLNIWATMNTSDQSLFPMDSAFKRRWEWEYLKIANAGKNWKIRLDDNFELIDWWEFLERINRVVSELTTSEDKQLGYFFCKPDVKLNDTDEEPTVISAKRFVNKVIFYLWNDVFKGYAYDADCCKDVNQKEVLYEKFYSEDGTNPDIDVLKVFFEKLKNEGEASLVVEKKTDDGTPQPEEGEEETPTEENEA